MPNRPTIDDVSKALGVGSKPKPSEFHTWGVAKGSATGGTVEVALSFGERAVCAVPKGLTVSNGQRVLVLVMRNGDAVVINSY